MSVLHFIGHWLGISDEGGAGYSFWSGIGSGSPVLAGIALAVRHHQCHTAWCWRFGHPVDPKHKGGSLACHKHHPLHPRRRKAIRKEPK